MMVQLKFSLFFCFRSRNNPKIISSEIIPSQKSIKIERPSTPKKTVNSNHDFELIKSGSSSPSTISVVSSSLDLTPLGSPLYSTAIAYSPTIEINCKMSSNRSYLFSSVDHHDKQAFELVQTSAIKKFFLMASCLRVFITV